MLDCGTGPFLGCSFVMSLSTKKQREHVPWMHVPLEETNENSEQQESV